MKVKNAHCIQNSSVLRRLEVKTMGIGFFVGLPFLHIQPA